jgi:hypothetical protein
METSPIHIVEPGVLHQLRQGRQLHLDHYGGKSLEFACLSASGIRQQLVSLEGPDAGRTFDVRDASAGYHLGSAPSSCCFREDLGHLQWGTMREGWHAFRGK